MSPLAAVLLTLLAVALAVYVVAIVAAGYIALHPFRSPVFFSPGAMGLPQEVFDVPNASGTRLRGTWVPHPDPRGVIVCAHGYCMNRSELAAFAGFFASCGLAVLLFDFRNHGGSARGRCGIGWYEREDVKAAAAEARRRAPGVPVLLLGSSMGSAAIAFAVGEDPAVADALVLDSCYDRLMDAAGGWWDFLGAMTNTGRLLRVWLWPVARLARPFAGFDPKAISVAESLRGYVRPVLLLHGRADTIAPPLCAERIAAAVAGPVEVVWFEHCDHAEMRWLHPDEYRAALGAFFDRIGLPPPGGVGTDGSAAASPPPQDARS